MTREIVLNEALERANKYDLLEEVKTELIHGSTPWEALYEWDLLYDEEYN